MVCRQRETTKALKRFVATPMSGTIYKTTSLYAIINYIIIINFNNNINTRLCHDV